MRGILGLAAVTAMGALLLGCNRAVAPSGDLTKSEVAEERRKTNEMSDEYIRNAKTPEDRRFYEDMKAKTNETFDALDKGAR